MSISEQPSLQEEIDKLEREIEELGQYIARRGLDPFDWRWIETGRPNAMKRLREMKSRLQELKARL